MMKYGNLACNVALTAWFTHAAHEAPTWGNIAFLMLCVFAFTVELYQDFVLDKPR